MFRANNKDNPDHSLSPCAAICPQFNEANHSGCHLKGVHVNTREYGPPQVLPAALRIYLLQPTRFDYYYHHHHLLPALIVVNVRFSVLTDHFI